jgi:hypothetical protein
MKRTIILITLLIFAAQASGGGQALSYYPVDNCRVIDTRVKTAAWCTDFNWNGEFEDEECIHGVPRNAIMLYVVAGDSSRIVLKGRGYGVPIETTIGDQGGAPDGCGIPLDAKVVNMMMIAIPIWENEPGHLKVWPFGVDTYLMGGIPVIDPPPNTSHINISPNETAESTWFSQQICDPATAKFADCNEDIAITARGAPFHVIIDVNGYFK